MAEEDQQDLYLLQHRAYTVLGQMLERMHRENLPAITWTIPSSNAGAILAGQCEATDPIQRQNDFEAWCEALGAEPWPGGIRSNSGVRLSASVADLYEGVTVTLAAFISNDET